MTTAAGKYKPGQWVRFRLGERMPVTMPCCGAMLDSFEILERFNGQTLQILPNVADMCPYCFQINAALLPIQLGVHLEFNGHRFGSFGAYEQEVELAVTTEICKCGHPEKDHKPKDIFGCWECVECEGYEPRQAKEEIIES